MALCLWVSFGYGFNGVIFRKLSLLPVVLRGVLSQLHLVDVKGGRRSTAAGQLELECCTVLPALTTLVKSPDHMYNSSQKGCRTSERLVLRSMPSFLGIPPPILTGRTKIYIILLAYVAGVTRAI